LNVVALFPLGDRGSNIATSITGAPGEHLPARLSTFHLPLTCFIFFLMYNTDGSKSYRRATECRLAKREREHGECKSLLSPSQP
jgi:hypothetical protein